MSVQVTCSHENKLEIKTLPLNEITDDALEDALDRARGNPMATQSQTFRTPCCGTCM